MTQSYAKTQRTPATEVYWNEDDSEEDDPVDSQNQSEIQNENENPNRGRIGGRIGVRIQTKSKCYFMKKSETKMTVTNLRLGRVNFNYFFSKWGLVTFRLCSFGKVNLG
jgi:hypothetical protein